MKYFRIITRGSGRHLSRLERKIEYITTFWSDDHNTIGRGKVNAGMHYNNPLDYLVMTKKKDEVIVYKAFPKNSDVIGISDYYTKLNCNRQTTIWTEMDDGGYIMFYTTCLRGNLFINLIKEGFEEMDL